MLMIGVMPMPPAIITARLSSPRSGNSFFGASIVNVSPTLTRSCMKREPPRPASSSRTANVYARGDAVAPSLVEKLISE